MANYYSSMLFLHVDLNLADFVEIIRWVYMAPIIEHVTRCFCLYMYFFCALDLLHM